MQSEADKLQGRKYFFDVNNFDAPIAPDPDLPPPPPLFTLDELGQARDSAFAQGREAGISEATRSREMYLAAQMERIAHDVFGLQLAEQIREKTYEREVVTLCTIIFERVFPHLNTLHGLDEIKSVVSSVIGHQPDVPKIIIDVPQTDQEEITQLVAQLPDLDPARIEIRGIEGLQVGSCRLQWKDGSALRDPQSVAEEILQTLRETLAINVQKHEDVSLESNLSEELPMTEGENDHA